MYQTILVPLDGSKRSASILPHVEQIARRFKSHIILMRVEEPPLTLERDEVVDLELCHQEFTRCIEEAESYLSHWKAFFEEKDIRADTRLAYGSVVNSILKTAQDSQADLIAMASHGLSGQPRSFYGSVAAGILQKVDRPLLIIRSRQANGE